MHLCTLQVQCVFEPSWNTKIYSYKISELHKYIVPTSFFRSFLCVWVQLKRLPKEANAAAPTIFYVWTRCLRWANTVLFVRWIDNVALYDGDIQHFASQFQTQLKRKTAAVISLLFGLVYRVCFVRCSTQAFVTKHWYSWNTFYHKYIITASSSCRSVECRYSVAILHIEV